VDYLLGKSSVIISRQNIQRIEAIEGLSEHDKERIFYTLDNLIKAAKLKTL